MLPFMSGELLTLPWDSVHQCEGSNGGGGETSSLFYGRGNSAGAGDTEESDRTGMVGFLGALLEYTGRNVDIY